ncbi:type II secretion system protein GspG [Paraflavitalea soli]|nr:type II secretion system protein GspG [Paraflavitalea soli]
MNKQNNPPYWIGYFCLLPLIGAFIGIALIYMGISRYKSKPLVAIGFAGVMITVVTYYFIFYDMRYGANTARGYAKLSQMQINSLANSVEYYKVKRGVYPDSLEQLKEMDPLIDISDPLLLRRMDKNFNANFYYEKAGGKYILLSIGIDGVAHTADDIYPVADSSSNLEINQ